MALFYNQATLSYNGRSVSSNVATGEIISVLGVEKLAVTDEYSAASETVYIVTITNSGSTAATALTVSDDLGEYTLGSEEFVPLDYVEDSLLLFVNGVPATAPEVQSASPLTIENITVPAGGNVMLIYAARVNEFASPEADGQIVNTVTVSGAGVTDITATETITARTSAELSITKSVSPTSVPENGALTYTFVIKNSGNAEATAEADITVTDTFDPVLGDISVFYNGEELTEGEDYTYNEQTGLFETVPGRITVPAATFTQDETTGEFTVEPGSVTLTVSGTIG